VKLANKLKPEWILRIFLGLMFLYSGYDIVVHPSGWIWAVRALPIFLSDMIENTVGIVNYLRFQGASELVLAAAFLGWFVPRRIVLIAAAVATIEMFGIVLMVGLTLETFRDIGLIGAAWALFVILTQKTSTTLKHTDPPKADEDQDVVVEVMHH
jgi:hypothetical protein